MLIQKYLQRFSFSCRQNLVGTFGNTNSLEHLDTEVFPPLFFAKLLKFCQIAWGP